jgi:outer membrane protein OmpA-like peptidoglycan-associated protein
MENIEDNIIDSLKSDAKGKFSLSVDFNKTYLFTVLKDGYYTQTKKITVKKEATKDSLNVESITYMMKGGILTENKTNDWIPVKDTLNMEIFLNKIIMNQSVIVENIYYDYNKWDIRPDAALILDNIVSMLKQNPNISIELSSHTDSRGADFYNYILSQKRAESAAKYIASKGINAKRITAKGYGKSKLINNCTKCTEEEYQMNRRTEFKVIKIGK